LAGKRLIKKIKKPLCAAMQGAREWYYWVVRFWDWVCVWSDFARRL